MANQVDLIGAVTLTPLAKERVRVDANGFLLINIGGGAAAAALSDALANPTTIQQGANLLAFNGTTWERVRTPSTYKDVAAVTITTITTVWTPDSGKKFRLMGGTISLSVNGSVLFEDNAAGAGNFIFRTPDLVAATPYTFDLPGGRLSAAINQVLKATSSAAGSIKGTLWGTEE